MEWKTTNLIPKLLPHSITTGGNHFQRWLFLLVAPLQWSPCGLTGPPPQGPPMDSVKNTGIDFGRAPEAPACRASHSLDYKFRSMGVFLQSSCLAPEAESDVEERAEIVWLLLLLLATVVVEFAASKSSNFSELFQFSWAPDHIVTDGGVVKLTLDQNSGCGFESRKKYLFGQVDAEIKLVEGDSAGTITAFYMSSQVETHDELDFKFLGNVTGEPYLVQTNIYLNGTGNREQRHTLWFDPTLDFHSYSLLWNHHHIIFLVDGVPIRTFTNREEKGIPFPNRQAMGIYSSVWNADDWATQGGRVKTNWSHAPFVSTFRTVAMDACEFSPETDEIAGKCREGEEFWWDKPALNELNFHQSRQLKWVRRRHLVYDYCKDTARFSELPPECCVD